MLNKKRFYPRLRRGAGGTPNMRLKAKPTGTLADGRCPNTSLEVKEIEGGNDLIIDVLKISAKPNRLNQARKTSGRLSEALNKSGLI